MIQDSQIELAFGVGLILVPPAQGQYVSSSVGIDLNPDYGTGQNARRAQMPGMGEEFLLRIDIITSFAIGSGTPVAAFHAAVSNLGAGVEIHTGSDFSLIGSSGSSLHTDGARIYSGYVAAQLVAGNYFFIRVNPWTTPMGRSFPAGAVVEGNTLRYFGAALTITNAVAAGAYFSAGVATAHLVKASDVLQSPKDFAYPVGTRMVG